MSDRLAALVAEWRKKARLRPGGASCTQEIEAAARCAVYAECAKELAIRLTEAALSSTAPAPCPECGGSRAVGVPVGDGDVDLSPCPRCSAQPTPEGVVVVARDVAREYVEASHAVNSPVGDEDALKALSDRYYDAQDALVTALAAALRQARPSGVVMVSRDVVTRQQVRDAVVRIVVAGGRVYTAEELADAVLAEIEANGGEAHG